jgi:hypothetical protein
VDLYIHSPIRHLGVVLNSLSTGTTLSSLFGIFFVHFLVFSIIFVKYRGGGGSQVPCSCPPPL